MNTSKTYIPGHFSTFPVNGKKPFVKWESFQERHATTDERARWERDFPDAGVGIACGPVSKIFVLDVDGPEGRASLEGRVLPKTPTVRTPRADGGRHYFYQWTEELNERVTTKTDIFGVPGRPTCGLDVRGVGGFVVFYGWELSPLSVPFAKPPKWLVEALPRRIPASGASKEAALVPAAVGSLEASKSWLADKMASMKEGNRNETFTALAGSLRARDYKPDDIFNLLSSKAKELAFPEDELKTICESVGRYKPRITIESPEDSIELFMADQKPVEWICKPVFARNVIGFFAGLPETQKTWLLLDFAIEAARGGKWLGRYPIEKSRVVFIDQERPKAETQRRIGAMMKGKGIKMEDIKGQFFARCGSSIKIDLQHSYEAFRKYLGERKPDVVFVDSFATFHTAQESNRADIQFVLEKIKELREEFQCTFIFIHHETKQSFQNSREGQPSNYLDMAGNVAIPAAAEHVFNVRRQDVNSCMLFHTKNNLGMKIPNLLTQVVDLDEKQTAIEVRAH